MGMVEALPYIGMVAVQLAQVVMLLAAETAIANGMTTFAFLSYSNIFSAILLLPICFSIYRSDHPPLLPAFLCGFFLLGFIGFTVQVLGMTGLIFSSASLSTTILNLIPGFTFVIAVILRLEKFNYRSATSMAKSTGTVISIGGAVLATLYQGPSLLGKSGDLLTAVSSNWVIGGLLLTLDSAAAAILIIVQALVVRKCPAVLILMLFYSCFIALVSAAASAIVEKDLAAWTLNLNSTGRFIPVILSGLFGNVFQLSIVMWCVRRKGPVFASIFHPIGVIVSIVAGVLVLGETFYLGSLLGAVVVVVGFYAVLWGKANEAKVIDNDDGKDTTPLLQEQGQLA
ncbi:WAT1-related protein At3g28050-like [Salvia splendens]|uniref:WAT1-related protein At3g28050-like n=1 Tax=Salvia splendens TaxID=180675 RepID=UPI001C254FB6|nr:WAT1-related protein At3g28050-like [Salvia splendens]XP_042054050.1 WAT1-related protein At3g28050-like [Salvia splendens]XP_042054051.1 WAT1-related protein At3g28050-like [Salvia splendens]XP_042054052.1 WAT1-related protein At3g28050-like [Salvia splendens]